MNLHPTSRVVLHPQTSAHCGMRTTTYFVIPWRVSITDIVLDVIRALGTHASVQDVYTYGHHVLGVLWTYRDVVTEMSLLLEEGRVSAEAA